MKREFLKGLDLDNETIDTIMVEYGKNVQGLKEKNDELTTENKSLSEKLKSFGDLTPEKFTEITNENKDLNAQLKMVDCGAKKEFSKFVRNEVMSKVDDKTDFETALKNYKEENPQYFGETVVKKVQSSPNLTGGSNQETTTNDIMNDILRGGRNAE